MLVFASLNVSPTPVEKNIAYIEHFIETRKTTDSSAILIGDSRIRHALRYGIKPHDIMPLGGTRDMAVLQFSMNSAIYNDFLSIEKTCWRQNQTIYS